MNRGDGVGMSPEIIDFLHFLRGAGLNEADSEERNQAYREMHELLIEEVRKCFRPQHLRFVFEPTKATSQLVREILETADPKRGAVALHLVGAILELRFPNVLITNSPYLSSDVRDGRSAHFQIGDSALHVTVSPERDIYETCKLNISHGLRPYLLVPEDAEVAAKQQAKILAAGKIDVSSIEAFVAQNLDELSEFTTSENARQMLRLLQIYNRRVDEAETDKSLLIEIPANLQGLHLPDQHSAPASTA